MIIETKKRLMKFITIGGLSTITNYLIFFILFQLFKINYLIASGTGYIVGVFIGFSLNQKLTFKSNKDYILETRKYIVVYTTSLFFSLSILKLLVLLGINPLIANIIAMFFTSIVNYFGIKYFVFRKNLIYKKINYLIYRFRYFITYTIIGLASLFVELLVIALLQNSELLTFMPLFLGFILGMFFSFSLNLKLNFQIPKDKNLKTFYYFISVSCFAFILNIILIQIFFNKLGFNNYSLCRFVSASMVFLFSYSLHRKITFKDTKQVGVAIYLSENEDVQNIKNKVNYYPDFIHIDLVDKTFNSKAQKIDLNKGKQINHYWPRLNKMTHIMSKKPSKWIKKVAEFSDYIFIHYENEENIIKNLKEIKKLNKKVGLTIFYFTPLKEIIHYLGFVDVVQILAIPKPGESNQFMEEEAIYKLNQLNSLKKRYNFEICIDGGIKLTNIDRINAKYVVSGSAVLNSKNIPLAINTIRTSGRYYYKKDMELKKYLKDNILKILKKTKFVVSGTIVGSFVDKKGIDGISDIDIIVIIDKLTKQKYQKIIQSFEKLKKIIKTDFNKNVIINPTFGPLKFDLGKNIVFHLMVYDIEGHISHCIKSPFTCLDWQRSKCFVKKPMTEIYQVYGLKPSNFFNSRRSLKDYLKDLSRKQISYREYVFKDKQVFEEVKYKDMNHKDAFEFAYHIMKFIMLNFLKLYYNKNLYLSKKHLIKHYSKIINNKKDLRFFRKINKYKQINKFPLWTKKHEISLKRFLINFEKDFNKIFYKGTKKIYFVRHQKTKMNKPNFFLGQRLNPSIIPINENDLLKFDNLIINNTFSSPTKRTLQTAKEIKKRKKLNNLIILDDLEEIDYGELDGKDYNSLKENYPDILNSWKNKQDPNFPDGENQREVCERLMRAIKNIQNKPGNSLIITHNVVLRCLIGSYYKLPIHLWYKIKVPHLEIIEIILTKSGNKYLDFKIEMFLNSDKLIQK